MVPSSASWRSNWLIWDRDRFTPCFHSIPEIISASDLLYQLRAKRAIRPFGGICSQNRHNNGRALSSSEGEPIEYREKPRGSSNLISSFITIVMPEACQPSTRIITGIFFVRSNRSNIKDPVPATFNHETGLPPLDFSVHSGYILPMHCRFFLSSNEEILKSDKTASGKLFL